MNGIDAPEIFSYECDDELENGIKAKNFIEEKIKSTKSIKVVFYKCDRYCRIAGDFLFDGKYLTEILLDVNLVRKYEYIKVRDHILNKRKSWCTEK